MNLEDKEVVNIGMNSVNDIQTETTNKRPNGNSQNAPCYLLPQLGGRSCADLELLFFSEEHGEADDGCVDEQTADYRHNHGWNLDQGAVGEDNGESCGEHQVSEKLRSRYIAYAPCSIVACASAMGGPGDIGVWV